MSTVKIMTDSSADMHPDTAARLGVDIVHIEFTLDGQKYMREWVDMPPEEFYRVMRAQDVFPKTTQPATQTLVDAFAKATEGGAREALMLTITSKFSGTYQGALVALEQFKEQYPNALPVRCVDSRLCTASLHQLVEDSAEMSADGMPMDEIVKMSGLLYDTSKIYCTVDTLEYLRKGGRIGKVGALFGGLLNIKPLIAFYDGELNPIGKVRGRKKAIAELAGNMAEDLRGKSDDYDIYIMHADCLDDAKELERLIGEGLGRPIQARISWLGTIIGCHIGPTTLAMGYMKKWRKMA